jgi:hypothetical protein
MLLMKFEKLEMNPATNPAVLDTGTWEPGKVWAVLSAVDESYFKSVETAVRQDSQMPADKHLAVYAGSAAEYQTSVFFLAGLSDGQNIKQAYSSLPDWATVSTYLLNSEPKTRMSPWESRLAFERSRTGAALRRTERTPALLIASSLR